MKNQIIRTALVAFVTGLTIVGITGCSTYTTGKDERSAGRALDDRNLATQIRHSLDQEPVYKFGNVDVKSFAGEVQLSGFVNSDDQRRRATEIASQTPGVMNVHNSLLLKPFAGPTPTGRTNSPQESMIYSTRPQQQSQSLTPQSTSTTTTTTNGQVSSEQK
jgi:hyperosmotically inducible protein